MNFLAHIYLSGEEPEIQLGNFIGDWVKGKQFENFPPKIKQGILLHRKIDEFTDKNEIFLKSSHRLMEIYGKYAGIVADILYDHFLAKNWQNYHRKPLKKFTQKFYSLIEQNLQFLPEKAKRYAPVFIKNDRLSCYADFDCFLDVLEKMSIYTSLPDKTSKAKEHIAKEYLTYEKEFVEFFEQMQRFVKKL